MSATAQNGKPPSSATRPLALITGASSGIGATFAKHLARDGYNLILVARRKDRLENVARELSQTFGIEVEVLVADLCKDDELKHVEERIAQAKDFEFLVNNAGFGTLPLFYEADVENQDRMHRLHVLATMRLTHAALPSLIARKKGFIVNVSSVSGFIPATGNVSYSSTKAWMNSFSEALYLELSGMDADVRVQALCPGFTYSEFHDTLGLDRSFVSKSWWMSADDVVAASFAGLKRNQLFVIPGLRYKLVVAAVKLLPRSWVHAFAKRGPASRKQQAARAHREA